MATKTNWNSFKALGGFLFERIKAPMPHFTFWMYFFCAVVGVGGFGVWEVLYDIHSPNWQIKPLLSAIYTYFPAVAMASAFDLILPDTRKYVRSFAIGLTVLSFVLAVLTVTLTSISARCTTGVIGCIVSLFLWWVANAENPNLQDSPPSDAALGGSADKVPKGSTSGFEV